MSGNKLSSDSAWLKEKKVLIKEKNFQKEKRCKKKKKKDKIIQENLMRKVSFTQRTE